MVNSEHFLRFGGEGIENTYGYVCPTQILHDKVKNIVRCTGRVIKTTAYNVYDTVSQTADDVKDRLSTVGNHFSLSNLKTKLRSVANLFTTTMVKDPNTPELCPN
ncbi:MAG: hypothetical protein FWD32_02095 [Firmicutes bacterium]|nr:hypothetical protein [Bacillota bacterium]